MVTFAVDMALHRVGAYYPGMDTRCRALLFDLDGVLVRKPAEATAIVQDVGSISVRPEKGALMLTLWPAAWHQPRMRASRGGSADGNARTAGR